MNFSRYLARLDADSEWSRMLVEAIEPAFAAADSRRPHVLSPSIHRFADEPMASELSAE
jgi:hypothetical protein